MKIVGHRGAKGLAPENTIRSIQKALEYKVDEIEVDVRVTLDKVPVLYHNGSLSINSGQKIKLSSCKFEDLKKYKPDIATLDEAISEVHGKAKICIEVKPRVDIFPIVKLIRSRLETDCNYSDLQLASFNFKILKDLKDKLPQVELVVIESWSGIRAGYRARELNAEHISLNHRWLWGGYLKLASRHDGKIYAYTLNDPQKAKRLQASGLAGVITDYPDRYSRQNQKSEH